MRTEVILTTLHIISSLNIAQKVTSPSELNYVIWHAMKFYFLFIYQRFFRHGK